MKKQKSAKKESAAEKQPAAVLEGLIDIEEALRILNTSRPTFYRWLKTGKLKGIKAGRQWRFRRDDIEAFLSGEEPFITSPADIRPFIAELESRIAELKMKLPKPDENTVRYAMNLMWLLGFYVNASDIHLSPHVQENGKSVLILRYRIDGVLHPYAETNPRLGPALIEQWKRMGSCDIHETTKPQNCRIIVETPEKKEVDMRVSFMPAELGESMTARILRRDTSTGFSLEKIPFSADVRRKITENLKGPWGMIIFSGPVGSGKTTVLYAALNHIAGPSIKTISIEDPIEFLLPWVVQTRVTENAGFATLLRSCMRADPDVIMVGEIRDPETLAVATQIALSGHLFMSTLHVDRAAAVPQRMMDMGGIPFVIAEALKLIVAQKLIRKLCSDCKEKILPDKELVGRVQRLATDNGLSWDGMPHEFYEPVGCPKCKMTGYLGRSPIAEALEITPEIGQLLRSGAPAGELYTLAIKQGMVTMVADGLLRASKGETSLTEVLRVMALK